MKKIIYIGIMISLLFLLGCTTNEIIKYDEVIYDCGSRLVKGTEINLTRWDLENGVEVYYLYEDNYSREYDYPMQEWFENFDSVGLRKGEKGCKEILRFYNYTEITHSQSKSD